MEPEHEEDSEGDGEADQKKERRKKELIRNSEERRLFPRKGEAHGEMA